MFTFSLTRTEPKGQNSHTCVLRGRDTGFPGWKTAFCPLQAVSKTSVLWQPQLGSAGPPEITAGAVLDVPLRRSSPARGVTTGSEGSMGWIELSSIWHFDKEQHILKLKPWKNMQKYFSHQQLITMHAMKAYEFEFYNVCSGNTGICKYGHYAMWGKLH